MHNVHRSFSCALLITMLVLVFTANFGVVQASTDVPSIINSNATWTKADSPYDLKGPVLVRNGVTLTVEAGATVNLNGYYLLVNGTFAALGGSSEKIHINDSGYIEFTQYCVGWNEQTSTGSVIENTVLSGASLLISNSPKITGNSVYGIDVYAGSPTISQNTISGGVNIQGGSPTISHNSITNGVPGSFHVTEGTPSISYNTVNGRIIVNGGSPTISYNTFNDGIHVDSRGGQVEISNNVVNIRGEYSIIFLLGVSATVSNNEITGNTFPEYNLTYSEGGITYTVTSARRNYGIHIVGSSIFSVSGNTISNCLFALAGTSNLGALTIDGNLVSNNYNGMSFTVTSSIHSPFTNSTMVIKNNRVTDNSGTGIYLNHPSATITNNTITNNTIGIRIGKLEEYPQSSTILNNNIYSNEYNLKSTIPDNVNATYNWWGTTDTQAISQTIYDLKYDFNLGTVTFVPFLTEPNPNATPIPEFQPWVLLPLLLTTTLLIIICRKRLPKTANQHS